jgi:hypothetical protein
MGIPKGGGGDSEDKTSVSSRHLPHFTSAVLLYLYLEGRFHVSHSFANRKHDEALA